jgi:hypothetical protein
VELEKPSCLDFDACGGLIDLGGAAVFSTPDNVWPLNRWIVRVMVPSPVIAPDVPVTVMV